MQKRWIGKSKCKREIQWSGRVRSGRWGIVESVGDSRRQLWTRWRRWPLPSPQPQSLDPKPTDRKDPKTTTQRKKNKHHPSLPLLLHPTTRVADLLLLRFPNAATAWLAPHPDRHKGTRNLPDLQSKNSSFTCFGFDPPSLPQIRFRGCRKK